MTNNLIEYNEHRNRRWTLEMDWDIGFSVFSKRSIICSKHVGPIWRWKVQHKHDHHTCLYKVCHEYLVDIKETHTLSMFYKMYSQCIVDLQTRYLCTIIQHSNVITSAVSKRIARVVKLPWIFPGASLKVNGAPGNIQGSLAALHRMDGNKK